MKWLALILAIAAAFLGYRYYQEHQSFQSMQAENKDLRTKLDASELAVGTAALHALDEPTEVDKMACARRAEDRFKSLGYSENAKPSQGLLSAAFESHYNPTLKRCIMLLQTSSMVDGNLVTSAFLSDVDEHAQLGEMHVVATKDNPAPPPVGCQKAPPWQGQARCKSRAEWDTYVRSLMN